MRTLRAALAVGATAAMVTAGLLVGSGSPAGAVELVANPGFESGTAGWTCTAETGTGTPAHTGASALVGTPTSHHRRVRADHPGHRRRRVHADRLGTRRVRVPRRVRHRPPAR